MILIDSRTGSAELLPHFPKFGIPADVEYLSSADFMFLGNGPTGTVAVGVERKTLGDLLNCITTGRLAAGQIPEMIAQYDARYLILEGIWRTADDGGIEEWRGSNRGGWQPVEYGHRQILGQDLMGYLTSLETFAGIKIRYTTTPRKTAECVIWLYQWWNKPWDTHGTFKVFIDPIHESSSALLTHKPSLLRRWAKELPGIGWKKSGLVEAHFPTALHMASASPAEWASIESIGPTIAANCYSAINDAPNTPPPPITLDSTGRKVAKAKISDLKISKKSKKKE